MRDRGLRTGYLLLKALPITNEVRDFIRRYPCIYVVEQNRDGQMAALLRSELPDEAPRIRSLRRYDGLPVEARSIAEEILGREGGPKVASPSAAAAPVSEQPLAKAGRSR